MSSNTFRRPRRLLAAGGLGYEISTFAGIVAPAFAANLYPWVLPPAFVGELGLGLWLIVKGVDVPKWEARARA